MRTAARVPVLLLLLGLAGCGALDSGTRVAENPAVRRAAVTGAEEGAAAVVLRWGSRLVESGAADIAKAEARRAAEAEAASAAKNAARSAEPRASTVSDSVFTTIGKEAS